VKRSQTKGNNQSILLSTLCDEVFSQYRRQYGLLPFRIEKDGARPDYPRRHLENLPALAKARANALQESERWGESYVSFLMPNVMFWVVPIEMNQRILGAVVGGVVAVDNDPYSHIETVNHLVTHGAPRAEAIRYVNALPVWEMQHKMREASEFLFKLFYQVSGWQPVYLQKNHARMVQQRQIAEEIHSLKKGLHAASPVDEERRLLSLMKAGDLRAARGELNRTLGIMFSQTANVSLLRAQAVEMMGYLVRAAVEDNAAMGALIEKNHRWMTQLIEADDFENLSRSLQEALDDFMQNMALQGHSKTGESASRALAWLSDHFHENVTLAQMAKAVGLSSSRAAHILKEGTGKSMLQHIHRLRVQEAQRLLERSDMSSSEIAYEVGFSDQSYFIKQFRRWMGVTPSKYRRMLATSLRPAS
jgi:AraC-like DNA-binding protein